MQPITVGGRNATHKKTAFLLRNHDGLNWFDFEMKANEREDKTF